jgi:hypothetical protein
MSYEQLAHRRKIAEALAAQKKGFPKNVGEGLTYLGESIGEAGLNYRLRQAEAAQLRGDDAVVSGAPVPSHTPTGGAAPPPSATVGPRAAADPAVSETVAAAEDGTEAAPATRLSYAPEAPRDLPPEETAAPAVDPTAVSRPPASILPMQDQRPPVPWTELAQGAKPGRPMEGVAMRTVPDPGNAQLRASPSPQAFFDNAPSMPMEPGFEGTPRLGGDPSSPTRVAQTDVPADVPADTPQVADVPLPRPRPEMPPAAVAGGPTFRTERNAEVGSRVGFDRAVGGLHPEMQARLMAAYNAMPDDVKKSFVINEGFRTGDYQQHLYDTRSGRGLVARPGHSAHEGGGVYGEGKAVDFDRTAALDWIQKNGRQFGLTGIRGDYPHIQMVRGGRQFYDPANPVALNAPGGSNVAVANGGYNAIDAAAAPVQVANTPREAVTNAMSIVQARDAPPSPTDAAQVARTQDVLGLGSQPRLAPTASLGRTGVASDAPPLGVNPVSPTIDAGVAEATQQRNAIAKELLNQQQKIPVPEEPVTGPTQAGTAASPSPTTTDSNLPATTETSAASPRLAQAPSPTVTDAPPPRAVRTVPIGPGDFGVPPSGVLGPSGAAPERTGTPTNIPAAPPPDSAAYVKVPPFKSAIEPPGPEPQRTLVPLSDAQKYWAPFINNPRVSPTVSGHAKQVYEQEEKFRSLKQTQADNDYVNKRSQWDKDVDAWKNKDERDVKTLTGRMALEKAQFDAQHMAPFEARQKAAEAALKEAELSRDPITRAKAAADLRNTELQIQQELFKLQKMNPVELRSKELANQEAQQKVEAGQHTVFNGRILKNVDGAWVDVSPTLNPDNIQMNEGQTKTLRYLERGLMARSQFGDLEKLTSLKGQTQANVKYIGNYLTSDEYKSAAGARDAWLINIVRDDTGAVIGKDELPMYRDNYFPIPGDGPRQIREKADRREAAERGLFDSLGTAKPIGERYRQEIKAMDATGVPDGAIRTDKKTGEVSEAIGGKWRPRKK